jgi:hypothetical protein
MKRFLLCLSICCLVYLSGAQNVHAKGRGTSWEKCYGTAMYSESANDICYVPGNVYAVVGYQMDYKLMIPSAYILIIDPSGNLLCSEIYNGPVNDPQVCIAYSVAAFTDPQEGWPMILVTGTTYNEGIFLVKYRLSSSGGRSYKLTKVFDKINYGDKDEIKLKAAYKIAPVGVGYTYDPHFVITGETNDKKMCLMEINGKNFEICGPVYTMSDASISSSAGYGVVELDRSHYYVCGKAVMKKDGTTQAFWIHLENRYGDDPYVRWMGPHTFGNPNCPTCECIAYAITKGPNAGFTAIAGKYGKSPTNSDYWLLTLNSDGYINNSRTWGDASLNEELHWIEKVSYNYYDYLVAGRADLIPDLYHYNYNVYLAGVRSSGYVDWSKYFGGSSQNAGVGFGEINFVRATSSLPMEFATGMYPGTIGRGDIYAVRYVP